MDKYGYFKNLYLEKEIAKIIENEIFLENYSIGEEIFRPETPINKVSIILSGNVRQIRKDSKKNTNIYKYLKNDFLFFPEVIYSLKNSFYYIAANDLQLISIEKDKFLNLLSENNLLQEWFLSKIFNSEKISILQKLFKEQFNNTLDKEQLLKNLSENIRMLDKAIHKSIQDKNIDSKKFEIYSISKSNHFNYLEKISFEKILELNFQELNKLVIINTDLRKSKIQNSSNLMNTTATAPYVIVVKKNAATLKNLNLKLDEIRINEDNQIVDRPMLLIDDEADNATIDLRSKSKNKKRITEKKS